MLGVSKNYQLLNVQQLCTFLFEVRYLTRLFFWGLADKSQIANQQIIPLSQIRKIFRYASPQIANPQISTKILHNITVWKQF